MLAVSANGGGDLLVDTVARFHIFTARRGIFLVGGNFHLRGKRNTVGFAFKYPVAPIFPLAVILPVARYHAVGKNNGHPSPVGNPYPVFSPIRAPYAP